MRCALTIVLILSAVSLPGCNSGRIQRENDRLRERVMDLEEQIEQLRRQNAEMETKLAEAGRDTQADPEDVRAADPRLADLSIGRLSHARDSDDDGRLDTLVLYVAPEDGRGRFIQLAGRLEAHAALLPAEGQATTIGQKSWSPEEVRDAYRSSFMGTHYTLELAIELPEAPTVESADVSVTYIDVRSGRRLESHRSVKLKQR